MADEVKIPINLPGAAQAATDAGKVAAGLQGIGKAAEGAKKSTEENAKSAAGLGEELQNLGRRNAAAKDVIEGIDSASRGGAGGLFGLAKAAKNLWEILAASSPLGRVVQLAAVAGAGFLALKERIFGAGEAAAETAPKVEHLAEAFKKAGDSKTAALATTLAKIQEEAKGAADQLQRVLTLTEAIEKAKTAAAKAAVNANADLSPEAKAQQLGTLDLAASAAARRAEEVRLGEGFFAAQGNAGRTASQRDAIAAELETLRASIAAASAETERRRGLELELAGLQRRPGGTSPEAMARGQRMADIAAELKTPFAQSPEFVAGQKSRITSTETDLEKAAKAATEAAAAFQEISSRVVGLRPDGSAIVDPSVAIARGLENQAIRKTAGLPEPESEIGTLTTVTEIPNPAAAIAELKALNAALRENGNATISQIKAMSAEISKTREIMEDNTAQIKAVRRG